MYRHNRFFKLALYLIASAVMLTASMPAAYAFGWEDLALTGVEIALAKREFQYYDNDPKGQTKMLENYKKQVGVSEDPATNEMLGRISTNLLSSIQQQETVKKYNFFVSPDKSINAFCGLGHNIAVNKGTFDKFNNNEDEIAFIVAHEIGHGQGRHLANRFNKQMLLMVGSKLYADKNQNNTSYILMAVTMNQIVARGFTLPNEWDADNRSFTYAVNSGYNPGAGAAAFVRMKSFYGDQSRSFFGQILSPNDHPTSPQRIENFSNKLTDFSGNHVKVVGSTVMVDNQAFIQPCATKTMMAQERAFLIAGNLARMFNSMKTPTQAYIENGVVKIDQFSIVEPTDSDESAEGLAQTLNFILGLN